MYTDGAPSRVLALGHWFVNQNTGGEGGLFLITFSFYLPRLFVFAFDAMNVLMASTLLAVVWW